MAEQHFREKFQLLDMQTQLARACNKQISFDADDIADIEQAEQPIIALLTRPYAHRLQPRAALLDVNEPGLSHPPDGLNASGDPHADLGTEFFRGLAAIMEKHLRHGAGEIETLAERLVPEGLDFVYARGALLKQFVFQRQN